MKPVLLFVAVLFIVACADKNDEADSERQSKLNDMYKTPQKSDRSKNKDF